VVWRILGIPELSLSHYLYTIIDPSTDEYYVGKRSCNCDPHSDPYMGSGQWPKQAKAAGRFLAKTILALFETAEELSAAEISKLRESENDPLCRNIDTPRAHRERINAMLGAQEKRNRPVFTAEGSRFSHERVPFFPPKGPENGTQNHQGTTKEPPVEPSTRARDEKPKLDQPALSSGFDQFWSAYPRKLAKPAAARAFGAASKRADLPTILAGVASYRFSDDAQFIPHPATWLNQDRWITEQVTPPAPDEWGAAAWVAQQPPLDPPKLPKPTCPILSSNGEMGPEWLAYGRSVDPRTPHSIFGDPDPIATVRDICEAAGLPPSWRGDKTWIAEICADRFETNNVIDVLRELSNASPQAVTSLRYWDSAIRQRCLRWDPERCDWWAPERKQRAA